MILPVNSYSSDIIIRTRMRREARPRSMIKNFGTRSLSEMARNFEELSPADVCSYLRENIPSISDEIFQAILDHKIDGEVFLSLDDEYLREIAPLLGDRLKIKRLISRTSAGLSNVRIFRYFIIKSPFLLIYI